MSFSIEGTILSYFSNFTGEFPSDKPLIQCLHHSDLLTSLLGCLSSTPCVGTPAVYLINNIVVDSLHFCSATIPGHLAVKCSM
jgi:hypothetical protein